jgi:hypothetical protein
MRAPLTARIGNRSAPDHTSGPKPMQAYMTDRSKPPIKDSFIFADRATKSPTMVQWSCGMHLRNEFTIG